MKKHIIFSIVTAFCLLLTIVFAGCSLLFGVNNISSVRKRVNKRRYEISETFISSYKEKNSEPIKALMCPMSQELSDLDEQIIESFSFMEGNIESYKISGDIGGEGYLNHYGTITEYDYYNDIYITTDTGRKYRFWFHDKYITDERIKGVTEYGITENDREEFQRIHVSCGWTSPYDRECGVLSAQIIKVLASEDSDTLKTLLCQRAANTENIDQKIQAAFNLFNGNPLFTEREDGIYRTYGDECKGFNCHVLGYDSEKDDNGNEVRIWVHVLVNIVYTDTGNRYSLDFVAYLANSNSDIKGVSSVQLEDLDTEDSVVFGEWIHEDD